MQTNDRAKARAMQYFSNTDYALKLYNQVHTQKLTMPNQPHFPDLYKPSPAQKQGELVFIGGGLGAVSYARKFVY